MDKIRRIELKTNPKPVNGFRLPFNHDKVEISQGYKSPYSHNSFVLGREDLLIDDRYCVDFKLPFGTEVVAAKDGVVYGAVNCNDSSYRGLDLKKGLNTPANFIIIEHDDLFTICSQLEKGSINLEKGDGVEEGQIIARTGESGWVGSYPHLHFGVYNLPRKGRIARLSVPVIFDGYQGNLYHPNPKLEEII